MKFQKDDLSFLRAFADPGAELKPAKLSAVAQDWHYESETKEALQHNCVYLSLKDRDERLGVKWKR